MKLWFERRLNLLLKNSVPIDSIEPGVLNEFISSAWASSKPLIRISHENLLEEILAFFANECRDIDINLLNLIEECILIVL